MKITKKLITLTLAALMLLSLAVPALALGGGDGMVEFDDEDDVPYLDWSKFDENGFYIEEVGYGLVYMYAYLGEGGDVKVPYGVTHVVGMFPYQSYHNPVTSVTLPPSLVGLTDGAFCESESLKSVTIPSSVKYIHENTFYNCPNLTDIYFGGSKEQWEGFEKFNSANGMGRPIIGEGVNATIHYNCDLTGLYTIPNVAGFGDVLDNAWFANPVKWAVDKGITKGTSATAFSPNKTCNNAEILTFLWRACGQPRTAAASFSDVASNAFYADAASWAKSKGMVSGSALSPETPCTRASTIMFIWQAKGCPTPAKYEDTYFDDVPANAAYVDAVAWGEENGITNGTSETTFSPDATCTRAEIVTLLYRAFAFE